MYTLVSLYCLEALLRQHVGAGPFGWAFPIILYSLSTLKKYLWIENPPIRISCSHTDNSLTCNKDE